MHERPHAAAEHHLLAEQIGDGLLFQRALDRPGPGAADRLGIGQGQGERSAPERTSSAVRRALRSPGAATAIDTARRGREVLRTHEAPGPVRRHQHGRDALGQLDPAEIKIEAVRRDQHVARRQGSHESRCETLGLALVGHQQRDDVALPGRLGGGDRLEAVSHRALVARRAGQLGDDHAAAAIAKVLRLGVALRAVAQDGDRLSAQQGQVGVVVVVDFGRHGRFDVGTSLNSGGLLVHSRQLTRLAANACSTSVNGMIR